MEKVYRRKLFISALMLIVLSIFNLSCSLIESPEEEGYLSFDLPKTLEATSSSRAVLSPNEVTDENPESYTVMLMIGKENSFVGKFVEKKYLPGDNVVIKGLKVGNIYSLIIKAESKSNLYEGISEPIEAKIGANTTTVTLKKIKKSKIKLDLTNLNLTASDTFDYSIIDVNGKVAFEETNIVGVSNYLIPYGFKNGKYKVIFTTSKSSNLKIYLENDGELFIKKESMGKIVPYFISSIPVSQFHVTQGSSNGNGSEKSPFNSLKSAIDKISKSDDINDICEIIVSGTINETEPIVIDKNIKLNIKGSDNNSIVNGSLIVNNGDVTISNLSVKNTSNYALKYNGGILNLGSSKTSSPFISSIEVNTTTAINVLSSLLSTSETKSYLIVPLFVENQKIFNTENPLFISHYETNNPSYYLDNSGLIKAKEKLNTSQVMLLFDGVPEESKYTLTITDNTPNKNVIKVIPIEQSGYIYDLFLNVGETYCFNFSDTTTSTAVPLGNRTLTIDADRTKNKIEMSFVTTLFVDENGNDYVNSGSSANAPLATITKALSLIQDKKRINPSVQNYVINIKGTIFEESFTFDKDLNYSVNGEAGTKIFSTLNISGGNIDINTLDIDDIKHTGGTLNIKESNVTSLSSTAPSIVLTDSTVYDLDITSSSINLNGTGKKTYIKNINSKSNSTINVNCLLDNSKEKINITVDTPAKGQKLINFDATNGDQGERFKLINNSFFLQNNGTIDEPFITVKTPFTDYSGRYSIKVLDSTGKTLLYTSPYDKQNLLINYDLLLNTDYVFELYDGSNILARQTVNTADKAPKTVVLNGNKTFYVDSNASDTNNGISSSSAFKTITKAISAIENDYIASDNLDTPYSIYLDGNSYAFELGKVTVNQKVDIHFYFESSCTVKIHIGKTDKFEINNGAKVTFHNVCLNIDAGDYKQTIESQPTEAIFVGANSTLVLEKDFTAIHGACRPLASLENDTANIIIKCPGTNTKSYIKIPSNGKITLGDEIGEPNSNNYYPIFVNVDGGAQSGTSYVQRETLPTVGDACLLVKFISSFMPTQDDTLGVGKDGTTIQLTRIPFNLINHAGAKLKDMKVDINLREPTTNYPCSWYVSKQNENGAVASIKQIYVHPDYDYNVMLIKYGIGVDPEIQLIGEYKCKQSTSYTDVNPLKATCYKYYVSNVETSGPAVYTNDGFTESTPCTLQQAFNYVKRGTDYTPCMIVLVCDDLFPNPYDMSNNPILNLYLDSINLTITGLPGKHPRISTFRSTDYNTTFKAYPAFSFSGSSSTNTITFDGIEFNCIDEQPVISIKTSNKTSVYLKNCKVSTTRQYAPFILLGEKASLYLSETYAADASIQMVPSTSICPSIYLNERLTGTPEPKLLLSIEEVDYSKFQGAQFVYASSRGNLADCQYIKIVTNFELTNKQVNTSTGKLNP